MTEAPDPKQVVADGYDRIADEYERWVREDLVDEALPRYAALLAEELPAGARVLELGCGGGSPTTQALAARFDLTGVDLSARQIAKARRSVPGATFIHADVCAVEFPPESFDAVASFYAFVHLPYGALPDLLAKIASWLRPGGLFVATMAGGGDSGVVEPDFLGAPMYFSGYATDDNRRFVEDARLTVVSSQHEVILENGRKVGFLWIVANKPSRSGTDRSP